MTPRARPDGGRRMPGVPGGRGQDDGDSERASSSAADGDGARASEAVSKADAAEPGVPDVESGGGDGRRDGQGGSGGDGGSCGSDVETRTETVHDLTTVFTFRALQALEDPAAAIADARSWSDWVGMVGEAGVPRMNTFLRRHDIRVDFFNGASSPAARLQRVADTDSSFGSERLVLVGVAGQDDVAAPAEWEFQPLAATAEEAGWRLRGADG